MSLLWEDLVPPHVAKAQRAWERRETVWRMRQVGMKLAEIGHRLGVSVGRARQILVKREYLERNARNRPPVMVWSCNIGDDLAEMAFLLKRQELRERMVAHA